MYVASDSAGRLCWRGTAVYTRGLNRTSARSVAKSSDSAECWGLTWRDYTQAATTTPLRHSSRMTPPTMRVKLHALLLLRMLPLLTLVLLVTWSDYIPTVTVTMKPLLHSSRMTPWHHVDYKTNRCYHLKLLDIIENHNAIWNYKLHDHVKLNYQLQITSKPNVIELQITIVIA